MGWNEDRLADLNDKADQEKAEREERREQFESWLEEEGIELDGDGCLPPQYERGGEGLYPDGSTDDNPGPGMGECELE